ncbi:MAG: hypothetical protein M3022_03470 [Actinomycetota bacterium]|nr:hypothetical protein [Actinomycetota bacterium]
MARAVAFVPDLLFGSNVIGALSAGGHDPVLVSRASELEGALPGADVLIVDLTDDATARIAVAGVALGPQPPRTLAFFSHVEADVKAAAEAAGFDLVVPRSRMARAAAQLVSDLAG